MPTAGSHYQVERWLRRNGYGVAQPFAEATSPKTTRPRLQTAESEVQTPLAGRSHN